MTLLPTSSDEPWQAPGASRWRGPLAVGRLVWLYSAFESKNRQRGAIDTDSAPPARKRATSKYVAEKDKERA